MESGQPPSYENRSSADRKLPPKIVKNTLPPQYKGITPPKLTQPGSQWSSFP